jgi:hypothetical protein
MSHCLNDKTVQGLSRRAFFNGGSLLLASSSIDSADWLLAATGEDAKPNLRIGKVSIHQCLDLMPPYGVRNGFAVSKILEKCGKVLGVFQGHFHWANYNETRGIPCCTIQAIVEGAGPENNSYAMLDILPGDVVRVTGFRKQKSHEWPAA